MLLAPLREEELDVFLNYWDTFAISGDTPKILNTNKQAPGVKLNHKEHKQKVVKSKPLVQNVFKRTLVGYLFHDGNEDRQHQDRQQLIIAIDYEPARTLKLSAPSNTTVSLSVLLVSSRLKATFYTDDWYEY